MRRTQPSGCETVNRRFYELDALRLVAAMSVLMFHYTFRGFAADDMSVVGYPSLAGVSKYGYLGVDMFFIISGFVILMTAANKSANKYASMFIMPAYSGYFIAGAVFYLISRDGSDAYKTVLLLSSYAFCLQNAFSHADRLAGHYRTGMSHAVIASVIALFYVVFLLIALNKTPKISSRWFAAAGLMTYPLYLIHENIGFMLINALHGVVNKFLLLLGTTAAVMVLAYVINKGIDSVCTRPFKKRLENTFDLAGRITRKATGRVAAQGETP